MIINIEEICRNTIKKMEETKKLEEVISKSIEESVVMAIRRYFEGFEFREEVSKVLNYQTANILKYLGIEDFNKYIETIVKDFNIPKETVKSIIGTPIKQIEVTEIFEKFQEYLNQTLTNLEKEELDFCFGFKMNGNILKLYGGYNCIIKICIWDDDCKIYGMYKNGNHITDKIATSRYNDEFHLWLLKLYLDKTEVIFDIGWQNFDTSLEETEEENY